MDASTAFRKYLGVDENLAGVFVLNVYQNGPAVKGGLRAGDFITAIDGQAVNTSDQLVEKIGSLKKGSSVKLNVQRFSQKLVLTLTPEARPADKLLADNSRYWPGFQVTYLDEENRKIINLTDRNIKGVIVYQVPEGSPAAVMGLRVGDVITDVNGRKISTLAEFFTLMDNSRTKTFKLGFYRNGQSFTTDPFVLK